MKHHKNIEQRTFLQDRFEILIKKQKKGQATFAELTELDEIVNKYATIRERILEEMHEITTPPGGSPDRQLHPMHGKPGMRIIEKLRSFFNLFVASSLPTQFLTKTCALSIQ